MSLARNIREQLLKSFRAELAEHIQTMTDGLLALEQGRADRNTLDTAFRAAHSLKGASRALGVSAIEQIAHSLESLLDGLRRGTLPSSEALFTTCYHALDTIQLVQAAYEAGETTPPTQALIVLAELEKVRSSAQAETAKAAPTEAETAVKPAAEKVAPEPAAEQPAAVILPEPPKAPLAAQASQKEPIPTGSAEPAAFAGMPQAAVAPPAPVETPHPTNGSTVGSPTSNGDETVRVDVQKLDALMANLSELLVARIRLEQRQVQIRHLQSMLNSLQKSWSPVRGPYNRLMREQSNGVLSLHRPRSVDMSPHGNNRTTRLTPRNGYVMETMLGEGDGVGDLKHLMDVSKDAAQLLRFVGASQEHLHDISTLVGEMGRQYAADTMHLSLVIDELESEIKRMRMLPFNTITGAFARMVRDLATQTGKEATLTVLGGSTEVDKRILEGIKDPLMHLLRNAVDHGIEKPDRRQALDKARSGQVTLSAEQIGKDVVIRVSDDGAGLDLEAIRQTVVSQNAKNGLQTGSPLSDNDLIDAIFNIGVSTSRIITDVSGRGVGLNIVRSNIEALHGRVEVESHLGEGTTFTLTLPLALTGSRSLMIKCAGQMFAVPINSVERSLHLSSSDVFTLEGHDAIRYENNPVPLVRLSDVLELDDTQGSEQAESKYLSAVVLTIDERRLLRQAVRQVAFLVDELVGEQEVVIKSLGKQLSRVAGVSGATVMGSGEVVLILNAADLMKLAARPNRRSVVEALTSQAAPQIKRVSKRILVVDDSITTRTLEKNILEAAGYTVLLATDGTEALSIVRSNERPDLIVTDIVMPRMDGFELTRQIKEDPQTHDLPVILVTSLDSQEDKEHGIEVEADAYIVKSSFDQVNLLDTIEQLI